MEMLLFWVGVTWVFKFKLSKNFLHVLQTSQKRL